MVNALNKQSENFEKQVKPDDVFTLASFQMAHILLKNKCPFTMMEKVVMPCLEIAARLLFGGKPAIDKVKKIPHSDTTVSRRCFNLSDGVEQQLIKKMKAAPMFSIQLDETTGVSSEAQLIVFCKFPDVEK